MFTSVTWVKTGEVREGASVKGVRSETRAAHTKGTEVYGAIPKGQWYVQALCE